MIKIFALKIPGEIEPEIFLKWSTKVSKERMEKVSRFFRKEDAMRSLFSELLVRAVISKEFNIPNEEIKFTYNQYGKPSLKNSKSFFFNVSHSGEWVVAIFHTAPIGIDVEKIRPVDIHIAERIFSDKEYQEILRKPREEQENYFFDLWSLKESYVKAVGKGLFQPFHSFSITKKNNGEIIFACNESPCRWFFKQYNLAEGYTLSACTIQAQFPEEVTLMDLEAIEQVI
ncbi:4'-phosphopantetheinyl transferase family protein [Peribacillus sp. NPDC096622]|uniref:4'-phosphopantetheinyl transferase family protein n=1 Tax=Peribacillus sp. NPDC096622 TaxID=3364396 RepID=UPI003824E24E